MGGVLKKRSLGARESLRRRALGLASLGAVLGFAMGPTGAEAYRYVPDPAFGVGGVVDLLAESRAAGVAREVRGVEAGPEGAVYVLYADLPVLGMQTCEAHQLARYLPTGALDAGFGSGGVVEIPSAASCRHPSLAVDQRQRPLLVWPSEGSLVEPISTIAIARFTIAGTPDRSFGSQGVALVQAPCPGLTPVTLMAGAGGHSILGFGCRADEFEEALATSPFQFYLVRLRPSGVVDPGFGRGLVTLSVDSGWAGPSVAVVEHDGSVVLSQSTLYESEVPRQTRLLRVRANGDQAPRYQARVERSLRRVATLGAPRNPEVATDFVLRGGDLVVSGLATRGSWVISLTPDGALNHEFSGDGYRRFAAEIRFIAAERGNDLLLLGKDPRRLTFFRLLANGSRDPSVGGPQGTPFLNPSPGVLGDLVSARHGRPLLYFTSRPSCSSFQLCAEPAELRRFRLFRSSGRDH